MKMIEVSIRVVALKLGRIVTRLTGSVVTAV